MTRGPSRSAAGKPLADIRADRTLAGRCPDCNGRRWLRGNRFWHSAGCTSFDKQDQEREALRGNGGVMTLDKDAFAEWEVGQEYDPGEEGP